MKSIRPKFKVGDWVTWQHPELDPIEIIRIVAIQPSRNKLEHKYIIERDYKELGREISSTEWFECDFRHLTDNDKVELL